MKRLLLSFSVAISVLYAQVQIQTPMPAQTSNFSINARGYYFVAPTCFTITGAEVPTDASSGNQSIAIVRFESTPPIYSATTDNFDVLYLTQDNPAPGILPMNIVINQGDIIGVMGVRANVNSYSNVGNTTTIDGFSVTLNRIGMQFPLATTSPQQLWTEISSNITRCWLYYDTALVSNITYSNVGADYTFDNGTDTLYTNLFTVWDYGDGSPLDTAHTPTHTYTANGTYNVCSYLYTSCGEIDTVCTSVNVCIFGPVAGYSVSTSNFDVILTDTSANGENWYWDFGDGDTSTLQNPTHTYATEGWYTITQIVGNSCGLNDTIIDSVLVCTNSVANFTTSNLGGVTTNFTDASTNATAWAWDFGDGNTSTLQNPTNNYATNGTYVVCLVTNNLCPADTFCTNITVCPEAITANYSATNTVFTANFTNSSSGATSYAWDFGDGNTSTSTSPSHVYATAGNYNVCLTSYDNCGDSTVFCDSVTIVGNVGIEEITETQSLSFYPNPAHQFTTLKIFSPQHMHGELYVTDITGKKVTTVFTGNFSSGETVYTLQTSDWRDGVYLIVWNTDQWKLSKKLLVN